MSPPPTDTELRLAHTLAATLHLGVADRALLHPPGELPLGTLVAAIDAALRDPGAFFPPHVRSADDDYTGVALERRADGTLWTHERHEVGVGRLSPVRSAPAVSLRAAVEHYVRTLIADGDGTVDGVRIDLRA